MARYRVEIINQGIVEKTSTINASTPIKAAIKAAGAEVTFRRNQNQWIKVTLTGASIAYEFVKARNPKARYPFG